MLFPENSPKKKLFVKKIRICGYLPKVIKKGQRRWYLINTSASETSKTGNIIILFSLSRIWSIIYSIRSYWVVIFCVSLIICISLIWFSCLLGCLLLLLNTLGLLLTWIVYWLNVYIIRIFHVLEYLLFLSIKYISITILLFISSTT